MKGTLRILIPALFALMFVPSIFGQMRVGVSVSFGPPAIPIYDQPVCPGDGYLWVPGYWAYDDADGYYWVPGTWVMPPETGFLWTPGWWGWEDTGFFWREGYWGPEVGFYGGINYGFGYFGTGFVGGRWDNGHFFYNTAVLHIDERNIHNVYNTRVENVSENRVSYNGGQGGITARPTPQEEAAARGRHVPPIAEQTQHMQAARSNPQMRAETNQGKPPVAATSRPGAFAGQGVVAARNAGAPYRPAPAGSAEARPEGAGAPSAEGPRPGGTITGSSPVHAGDVQAHQFTPAPSSGDTKADRNYEKEQQKLADQQNKEHQQLAKQQQKEDQQAARQNQNEQQKQLIEQHHQQQTQSMEQRHTQQQQQMQTRAPAPRQAPAPQQRSR